MIKQTVLSVLFFVCSSLPLFAQEVNLAEYSRSSPVKVEHAGDSLTVEWPAADEIIYKLVFNISGENPLMESIAYEH